MCTFRTDRSRGGTETWLPPPPEKVNVAWLDPTVPDGPESIVGGVTATTVPSTRNAILEAPLNGASSASRW